MFRENDLLFVVKKKTPLKYSVKFSDLYNSNKNIFLPMLRRKTVQYIDTSVSSLSCRI